MNDGNDSKAIPPLEIDDWRGAGHRIVAYIHEKFGDGARPLIEQTYTVKRVSVLMLILGAAESVRTIDELFRMWPLKPGEDDTGYIER